MVDEVKETTTKTHQQEQSSTSISNTDMTPKQKQTTANNTTTASSSTATTKTIETTTTKTVRRSRHGRENRVVISTNANPIRDIIIFILILLFLMYSTNIDLTPKKKEDTTSTTKSTIEKILKDLIKNDKNYVIKEPRIEPCTVFVDTASMIENGVSFYAGKEYTIGDIIFQTNDIISISDDLVVPVHDFILKHHPKLVNVESIIIEDSITNTNNNNNKKYQIRAIRNINAGEELFVTYNDNLHKHEYFNRIPNNDDYQLIQDIVSDTTKVILAKDKKSKRNTNNAVGSIYKLIKRSIGRVNPRLASLLPTNHVNIHEYDSTLNIINRTIDTLKRTATCIDDIIFEQQQQNNNNNERSYQYYYVITRNIEKSGTVIASIPLIAINNNNNNNNGCFTVHNNNNNNNLLLLCPLLFNTILQQQQQQQYEKNKNIDDANVKLSWRDDDIITKSTLIDIASNKVPLVLDITTLKSLKKGDTLIFASSKQHVNDEKDSESRNNNNNHFELPQELMKDTWEVLPTMIKTRTDNSEITNFETITTISLDESDKQRDEL